MKIIIIGCGKVGLTLAEKLQAEDHDLVLIDQDPVHLHSVSEEIDALRILGNGSSIQTLREADIEHANVLIAVTASDELNLLCCLVAKKVSRCHTVARVRDPVYHDEMNFIKEKLGISMIINPELAAAMEISRLLLFPSAIKIDTFAKNRIELLKFRLQPKFNLDGVPLSMLKSKTHGDVLVCGVERGSEVFIPSGDFVLKDNDTVSIVATPRNASDFFESIGLNTHQVKNALIVGGGKIAYYLVTRLSKMNIDVRIIERSRQRCEELAELFPKATIICGDGTDHRLLLDEGMTNAEAFVSMTDMDEENILLSLNAKACTSAKLVTKVNRIDFDDLIDNLDIGSVIYPKYIAADTILQYVRAMHRSIGSNVETLYQIFDSQAEGLEFLITEESEFTDTPLCQLPIRDNVLIASINRHGIVLIPRGQDRIQVGDTVIVITTHKGLKNFRDIMQKSRRA